MTCISVGPVTIPRTHYYRGLKTTFTIPSYHPEQGLFTCGGALVYLDKAFICNIPVSAFLWPGQTSFCVRLLSATSLGVHRKGAAESFYCPCGRNFLWLHTVYSMGFMTHIPKSTKSKFLNKYKQRGKSEHDQVSTISLKQLFTIASVVHRELAVGEWSAKAARYSHPQVITWLYSWEVPLTARQFYNTLNTSLHLLIEKYEVSKCAHTLKAYMEIWYRSGLIEFINNTWIDIEKKSPMWKFTICKGQAHYYLYI